MVVAKMFYRFWLPAFLLCFTTLSARAQSFQVQCPNTTITHPAATNNSEPTYVGPTYTGTSGYPAAPTHVNGAIKCQQISGGDGFATMGDGTQTYMFSFGPLSGLSKIAAGLPGTDFPNEFNVVAPVTLVPGDPATTDGPIPSPPATPAQLAAYLAGLNYNGAVGLA